MDFGRVPEKWGSAQIFEESSRKPLYRPDGRWGHTRKQVTSPENRPAHEDEVWEGPVEQQAPTWSTSEYLGNQNE